MVKLSVDIRLKDPISKPLCMIDIPSQKTLNSKNLWSPRRDGGQVDALTCTQSLSCEKQLHTNTLFYKTVIIQQMLSSSRKSLRTQITERTQSGSPHRQSVGSAVWIHEEAPGNGFLMGSWQDWWADRRYVKYLLFWLLLELWPYLKQGPNKGHFGGDYSPAACMRWDLESKCPGEVHTVKSKT